MKRKSDWTIRCILGVCGILSLSGCDGGLAEGILIGAGSSTALAETQQLAEQKKTVLIGEVLRLRQELTSATDPAEVEALKTQLANAEKKQAQVEMTNMVSTLIQEAIQRDWGAKPTQGQEGTNNLAYILGTAATLAAGYAGKKTLESNQKSRALAAVKIAAKPDNERAIYEKIGMA